MSSRVIARLMRTEKYIPPLDKDYRANGHGRAMHVILDKDGNLLCSGPVKYSRAVSQPPLRVQGKSRRR